MGKLIYETETFKIIGAAITVHKGLEGGFLEPVYHEALEMEFQNQNIPFGTQKKLNVYLLFGQIIEKIFCRRFYLF